MKSKCVLCCIALHLFIAVTSAFAQGTAFTYQGQLKNNGLAASGTFDLQFTVYDAGTNGSVVGVPVTNAATTVSNGLFTAQLDFGAGIFDGNARWLQIGIRTNGYSGAFALLTPLQPVTSSPYAIQAVHAATATSASTATTAATANSVSGTNITDTIATAQLPPSVVLNNGSALTLTGALTLPTDGLTVGANQINTTYNRVGIGRVPFNDASNPILINSSQLANPKLEVQGGIAIPGGEEYAFRTAKTRYLTIPNAALISADSQVYHGRIDDGFSSATINGLGSLWAEGGTAGNVAYFIAPVNLPNGAIVTSLKARLIKNGGSMFSVVELFRSDSTGYSGNTAQLIATASTGASAGSVVTVTSSSVDPRYYQMDNQNYQYFLRYSGEQNTQNERFVSALITYQVNKVE
ncbi:MAG: hypothetical protein JWQ71_731 [Pedosphaera sp.]|nr:hypothetical protein [Pedosphaera sp.]